MAFTREALRRSNAALFASALRRTLRIATERPRAGLWALLVATSAMIIAGVVALAALHVDRWTLRSGAGASMVVYLGEGVDDARARALTGELRALAGVERAELIPPAESARRLQQALGTDTALLAGVDVASLPASIEVTLAPGVGDVVAMSPTVRALRGTSGVEDLAVDATGEDRTATALGTVRTVVWTGGALLAGLALIIVLATIRTRCDRGGEEQAVAHLLGGGPSFLALPTAFAGALLGALAALLAALAIALALHVYREAIVAVLAGPLGAIELALPAPAMVAAFVALGGALGLAGGGLAGASRVAR